MNSPAGGRDPAALFARAYQDAIAQWPVAVTPARVPTDYGATHVLISGAKEPAALLLPGGGATAVAWRAVAGGLSRTHRVIAVDPIGQPGLSVPGGRPVRTGADLDGWLDQVLDGLGVSRATLAGHSYGAWLALRYALHSPGRVSGLVLLDPTDCFAPLGLRYRLHAVPLLARPTAGRMRRFLAWESGGRPLDETWLAVVTAGHDLGRMKVVMPKRPSAAALSGLRLPVLVIAAGQSRAHDPRRIVRLAERDLPDVTTATLPRASHHSLPTQDADQLLRLIEPFAAGASGGAGFPAGEVSEPGV